MATCRPGDPPGVAWPRPLGQGQHGASKVKRLAPLTLSWGPHILNSILGCPVPSVLCDCDQT